MFQVRIHGRGGQGVVSGAELLAIAAFREGRHAQAFPSFGSERMGAPVMAFCRIDDREIRLREPVMEPDVLIIQDPTLLHQVDLFKGLAATGLILINSTKSVVDLGLVDLLGGTRRYRLCRVPATEIAQRHVGRPVPNTALLGCLVAASGAIRLESIIAAIREKFAGNLAEGNVAAAGEAYTMARESREAVHA
jgi:pyruvate ferredoxin oxidoreductase gamma subunit